MSVSLTPLFPADLFQRLQAGTVLLVDVREPDEHARERIDGAVSAPLSTLTGGGLPSPAGRAVVFHCKAGSRTAAHAARLAACAGGEAWVLAGGLDAWKAQGLPLAVDRKAPLELMRQVQIVAGSLVLAGVALGLAVHPAFFGVSAFVGAGLTFAGISGWCGMARLLARAPWNRAPA